MVLAHRERLTPKKTQADLVAERMQRYAETGQHPGPLPTPGVFARHNAVDTPALLPDGSVVGAVGLGHPAGPRAPWPTPTSWSPRSTHGRCRLPTSDSARPTSDGRHGRATPSRDADQSRAEGRSDR